MRKIVAISALILALATPAWGQALFHEWVPTLPTDTVTGDEFIVVVDGGSKKTTAQSIANLASGASPRPVCATIELATDSDDNVPIYPAPAALTITGVGCRITGTALTLDFEDADANTIRASVPCDTGNSITYITGGLTNTTFTSGEFMQFDVNGTPTTPGWATVCVTYTLN